MNATDPTTHEALADLLSVRLSVDGETYPFTEDENCNITGLGHQDEAAFAAAVNRFEAECYAEPPSESGQWTADHINHDWVVLEEDQGGEVRLRQVPAGTTGAVAVTTLWRQR